MADISLKELLARAEEAENSGKSRDASSQYAALGIYLRRRNRPRDACLFFQRAIRLCPTSPRLYLQLALCEMDLGNQDEAANAMDRFTKYSLRKKSVREYREYLEKHLSDQPALRKIFYEGLLQLDRTDAEPFLACAKACEQLDDLSSAKKLLVKALLTKSAESEVLGHLREVLKKSDKADQLAALLRYEKGELLVEDLVLILSGESKPAQAEDQKWRGESAGDKEQDLNSMIKDLEKDLGIQLDEPYDAVAPLVKEFRRRSEEIIADHTKTRMDLASAFFEMGLKEDAREELKAIAKEDPYYLESQLLLTEILFSEEGFLAALDVVQGCLRHPGLTAPVACEARYKLIQIYHRLGDLRQAFQVASRLADEVPDYRDVRQLRDLLGKSIGIHRT